ncbi:MAG: 3-oxoacyl-ACP synthase III [Candidatus Nitrospinota bacterium M3_3B_026]
MRYENVCLAAAACELPPNVVTSESIEKRLGPLYDKLGLREGRLELMTGIRERRFWDNGQTPGAVAVKAGRKALAAAKIPPEELGALFHASVCRDFMEPATACGEHRALGLPENTLIFDVSNACLGVLDAMVTLANMIELGQARAGIILAGETGEALVNGAIEALLADKNATRQSIKPAFASLTIGSGAAAVVLAHKDLSPSGHRLAGGVFRCDTENADLCVGGAGAGFGMSASPSMETDSEELLKAGCALAKETWGDFKAELGWTEESVDRSFTHQVGSAHRRLLYESIGVDPARDFSTVEFLGNMGSVSLPATLAMGAERGLVKKGGKVALLGIGSGLNCLMLGLEW